MTSEPGSPAPGNRASALRRRRLGFGPSQVNAALGLSLGTAFLTGLAGWALPDATNDLVTTVHAVSGLAVVALMPSKLVGPVRTGLRRSSMTRWLSVLFGVLVLASLGFGTVHALGISYGIGLWSPLWTHQLLGFSAIVLGLVHVVARRTRPSRPRVRDVSRRDVLRLGAVTAGVAVARIGHEPIRRVLDTPERRGTGSYEVSSYDPAGLPVVYWINDRRPADTSPENWHLTIQGRSVQIADLWPLCSPVDAILDCTGGWWSAQRWDAVPLSALIESPSGRSIQVTSTTGYKRWYGLDDLDTVHIAVGYDGEPLHAGHGAPVRLIIPGRRGPEWIKWVTNIEDSDRPAWLTSPLPLS